MPAATALISSPLPSPAAHHTGSSSDNVSALFIILLAFSVVGVSICIYAFFMLLKCPPNPFRPRRRPSSSRPVLEVPPAGTTLELVTEHSKYSVGDGKDFGSECPVCLLVFVDGEDVRRLKVCQHVFHGACIDKWLRSHPSCPICRASVPVKRSQKLVVDGGGDDDFRQGLPNSASLI